MNNILLRGIVGSTAYGLAGPNSDIDELGLFAVDTEELHGLQTPKDTITEANPDRVMHEAHKFCKLAISCNPTVTELLWLPDDLYLHRTELGNILIGIRDAFLSANKVRNSYLGYATQQFRKLTERGGGSFSSDTRNRSAKHARHLARLIHQGTKLYTEGKLEIRLSAADAARFTEFGDKVANGDIEIAQEELMSAGTVFNTLDTVLPKEPNEELVNKWLLAVRRKYYLGYGA